MDYQTILRELRNKASYLHNEMERIHIAIEAVEALAPPEPKIEYLMQIEQPEAEPEAPPPVETKTNGSWDRHAFRRQVQEWRMRYPLGTSYFDGGPSQMVKQAVCAVIQDHPRFKEWLRVNGEKSLRDSLRVPKHMMGICDYLGVDYEALEIEAQLLHADMLKYGTPGVDYQTRAK
jgi:hypothetical protein